MELRTTWATHTSDLPLALSQSSHVVHGRGNNNLLLPNRCGAMEQQTRIHTEIPTIKMEQNDAKVSPNDIEIRGESVGQN